MKKLLAIVGIIVMIGLVVLMAAQAGAMTATLAWDANSETDLAGYRMYYDEDNANPPYAGTGATEGASPIQIPLSALPNSSAPEFRIHGLINLKKYWFGLTAYNTSNQESGYSNIVQVGPIQYMLTTSVVGTGGTISPSTGAYAVGQVVALTATPAQGYRVKAWTGTSNDASIATTNTVTMTAAKTVTVTFELIPVAPAAPKNLRVVAVQ